MLANLQHLLHILSPLTPVVSLNGGGIVIMTARSAETL